MTTNLLARIIQLKLNLVTKLYEMTENNIDFMLFEFEKLKWTLCWEDFNQIIIDYPITVSEITAILFELRIREIKITADCLDFLKMIAKKTSEGFTKKQIVYDYKFRHKHSCITALKK